MGRNVFEIKDDEEEQATTTRAPPPRSMNPSPSGSTSPSTANGGWVA